jgi:quercetin dioxygenase-like cupin family protein
MTTISKPTELNFLGAKARILASGETLGLVHMDMPAGEMPPLHVHRNDDEGFYVLGGDLTLFLPGDAITLRPGEFFLAPRGIPHAYEVGPDGARARLERPVGLRALRRRGRRSGRGGPGHADGRGGGLRHRDPRPAQGVTRGAGRRAGAGNVNGGLEGVGPGGCGHFG